jgi:hypothetical protein
MSLAGFVSLEQRREDGRQKNGKTERLKNRRQNNQVPRYNNQTRTNNQKTEKRKNKRTKTIFGYWCLNIGICLVFVSW